MASIPELRRGSGIFFVAVLIAALGSACGSPTSPTPAPPTGPSVTAPPPPTPTPSQYTATPVPFNLTESRMVDILGWDSWPDGPTPSTILLLPWMWRAVCDPVGP